MSCFLKRKTEKNTLPSWRKRFALLCFALLQNGLVGGITMGWASIDDTMLAASLEEGGAGLTRRASTVIFSYASSISMVSTLFLGFLLDAYGPRVCSMVSSLIVALGCQVFASSHEFAGFALGTCLIAFGGPGVTSSIIHISNLFPNNENLAMSSLCGSIVLSFSVYAVFDIMWQKFESITFRTLFGSYVLVLAASAAMAFWLYPDESYEKLEEDYSGQEVELLMTESESTMFMMESESESMADTVGANGNTHGSVDGVKFQQHSIDGLEVHLHHDNPSAHPHLVEQPLNSYLRDERKMKDKSMSYRMSAMALDAGHEELTSIKDQPFYNQVLSATFLRAMLVFVITCFCANFYIASITTELADLGSFSVSIQHELALSFTMIMSIVGITASVVSGWLIDRLGLEKCTVLTLVMGQLQMLFLYFLSDNRSWVVASFWLYTLFRQFLYPVFISSLTSHLGFKYFGKLLGIGYCAGGLAQMFLASLVEATQAQGDCPEQKYESQGECDHGSWKQLHIIEFVAFGALMIVPLLDRRDRLEQERLMKTVRSIDSPPRPGYGAMA